MISMEKIPLDYATPPPRPARPSPLWVIARLIVAVPFAWLGTIMFFAGIRAMFEGQVLYTLQFLWGVLLVTIAVLAMRLPARRNT